MSSISVPGPIALHSDVPVSMVLTLYLIHLSMPPAGGLLVGIIQQSSFAMPPTESMLVIQDIPVWQSWGDPIIISFIGT